MPTNETGKAIVHKGFGNMIIHPGDYYPGREVDANGDYLPAEPATQKEAPAQGASAATAPVKLSPEQWPDRAELEGLNMEKLKAWATAQELEFLARTSKGDLLNLIDDHRPAPPAPPVPPAPPAPPAPPEPASGENENQ